MVSFTAVLERGIVEDQDPTKVVSTPDISAMMGGGGGGGDNGSHGSIVDVEGIRPTSPSGRSIASSSQGSLVIDLPGRFTVPHIPSVFLFPLSIFTTICKYEAKSLLCFLINPRTFLIKMGV